MRIAVIGAGQVGHALGGGWSRAGHEVVYGVRDPGKYAACGGVHLPIAEAAKNAEAVVLATPWDAAESALAAAGSLAGKILIDCTNPLVMGADGPRLAIGHDASAGEWIAALTPGASVFKAFNTTGADNMRHARDFTPPPVMFVAGEDDANKPIVLDLARDLGFAPVDAGPLSNARLLEPLAMLWIDQAMKRGAGGNFAFAITHRPPS